MSSVFTDFTTCVFCLISRSFGWQSGSWVSHKFDYRVTPLSPTHTHILPTPTLLPPMFVAFFSHKQGLQGVPGAFLTTIRLLFWIKSALYTIVRTSPALRPRVCLNIVNSFIFFQFSTWLFFIPGALPTSDVVSSSSVQS